MIRERMSIHRLAAFGLLVLALSVAMPAIAQDAAETEAASEAGLSVEGFRSARFGMTQAEVREAISTDFGIEGDAVVGTVNPAERTGVLSISGVETLAGGGEADISYVFGHRSEALSQVSVLWSAEPEGELTPEQLLANADVLLAYFLSAGYQPGTVVTNVVVPEGLIVFRGSDEQGRMTVLLMRGATAEPDTEGETPSVFTPTSLLLAYLADPTNPDVFQVEPGTF